VRWHLVPSPSGRPGEESPGAALEYEVALFPELVLRTHVEGVWTAVDAVLRLALRLHGETERRIDDRGELAGPAVSPALGAPRRGRDAARFTA
jgi:hypothetical protein